MDLAVVYVTVGTTQFEALIQEIVSDRTLQILKQRKCRKLILQLGNSSPVNASSIKEQYHIEVEQYKFKYESIRTDIVTADLVIGHAGAGTCMDILRNNKPGLLIINQELMNNHQMELALQLSADGYIINCDVTDLSDKLQALDYRGLRKYSTSDVNDNMQLFVNYLNLLVGQK